MHTYLTRENLKLKIGELLQQDDRTFGYLAEVRDAIFIMERVLPGTTNWSLGAWGPFERLAPDLQAALLKAEATAQTLYRIFTAPLGSSAAAL